MPLTTPKGFTVAIPAAVEVHTPPIAASVSDVVEPAQTVPVPVMLPAAGIELTVITTEDAEVPQVLVTL